jgi:hypothetical protein
MWTDPVVAQSNVTFQPLQRWKVTGAVFQGQQLEDQVTDYFPLHCIEAVPLLRGATFLEIARKGKFHNANRFPKGGLL